MVDPLLDSLRKEFYGMVHTKRQANIEGKVRNVRYQGKRKKQYTFYLATYTIYHTPDTIHHTPYTIHHVCLRL
ncbi:hypothetical protein EON63_22750 [archaeon]|nr:MAG: hypothetical protein EON63_22750 [archaeon]